MFEQISSALNRWLENVRQQKTLSEKELNQLWSELRIKLLESDVHFKVVKEIIDSLQKKLRKNRFKRRRARASGILSFDLSHSFGNFRAGSCSPKLAKSILMSFNWLEWNG